MARVLSRRGAVASAVVGVLVAAASLLPWAPASAGSSAVSGRFVSSAVTGPSCASTVGVCAAGVVTGRVKGTFTWTATSVITTVDTPSTGIVLYTADVVVTTDGGTLSCKDAGALRTGDAGPRTSTCAVTGGTGAYAGASGYLQLRGVQTAAGDGAGDYAGVLATP